MEMETEVMEMETEVEVAFDIFKHIINENDIDDKGFYTQYKYILTEMKYITKDIELLKELERRNLGYLSTNTERFYPSRNFPLMLRKMLKEKIQKSPETTVDVTDLLQLWATAHDIAYQEISSFFNR